MSQQLKFNKQFFRDLWALLKPYWVSEEKWIACLLLLVVITCIVAQIRIGVWFNYFRGDFFNALQNFNKPLLIKLVYEYVAMLIIAIIVFGYNVYFNGLLTIRWRRWLTQQYLADWLEKQAYYRMQVLDKTVDNPDQRISEDLDGFSSNALGIFSNLLNAVLSIFAFGAILWGLSGALHVPLGSHFHITIPGYLLWAALLYACLGTWLNAIIGRKLPGLSYLQQRYNANFRFSMARLREVSEQVAMYRGEAAEGNKFKQLFKNVYDNFVNIIKVQKRLMFFQSGYTSASFVFGLVVALPLFFAKAIQIGGVMQVLNALDNVITSFSIFISLYATLADWRSGIFRLTEFSNIMKEAQASLASSNIQIIKNKTATITVKHLDLMQPNGDYLLQNICMTIKSGETLLLTGDSGVGKSTLLRAIAGIWPYGHGTIIIPQDQKIMFLPQKPYLPLGTLRDALLYPSETQNITNENLSQILIECGLEKFQPQLSEIRNWSYELSLGEQQLIAFVRVLLQKPDWVFLDEATSALDEINQAKMYLKLRNDLPTIGIISVGHRSSLHELHGKKIHLKKNISFNLLHDVVIHPVIENA
jgi:putative ATP-binding cassette transporter